MKVIARVAEYRLVLSTRSHIGRRSVHGSLELSQFKEIEIDRDEINIQEQSGLERNRDIMESKKLKRNHHAKRCPGQPHYLTNLGRISKSPRLRIKIQRVKISKSTEIEENNLSNDKVSLMKKGKEDPFVATPPPVQVLPSRSLTEPVSLDVLGADGLLPVLQDSCLVDLRKAKILN